MGLVVSVAEGNIDHSDATKSKNAEGQEILRIVLNAVENHMRQFLVNNTRDGHFEIIRCGVSEDAHAMRAKIEPLLSNLYTGAIAIGLADLAIPIIQSLLHTSQGTCVTENLSVEMTDESWGLDATFLVYSFSSAAMAATVGSVVACSAFTTDMDLQRLEQVEDIEALVVRDYKHSDPDLQEQIIHQLSKNLRFSSKKSSTTTE